MKISRLPKRDGSLSREAPLIAIFLPSLRGGGAERAMLVFGEELLQRGYRVDLVLATLDGSLASLVPSGIRIVNLEQRRVFRSLPKLVMYLRKWRPSALYSTIVHANVVASLAARVSATGVPVVVRESNVPVTEPKRTLARWVTFKLIPRSYRWARGIIAVSQGVADELVALHAPLSKRLKVIPTPIVSDQLLIKGNESADHPWLCGDGPPVILGAARLQPHKGFIGLVRAFAEIRRERNVRLLILGEGPERERILEEARVLGVEHDVDLAGFKTNPFPFMKRADVFALTSEYEGLPNVLVQAMAFGTPVVATDCKSGPAEILDYGKYGGLVPVGNHSALVAALRDALSSTRREDAALRARNGYSVTVATTAYLEMAGLPATAESVTDSLGVRAEAA